MPRRKSSSNVDIRLRNMNIRTAYGLDTTHMNTQSIAYQDDDIYLCIIGKRICRIQTKLKHNGKYLYPHMEYVSKCKYL